jgi:hypothetical protein
MDTYHFRERRVYHLSVYLENCHDYLKWSMGRTRLGWIC